MDSAKRVPLVKITLRTQAIPKGSELILYMIVNTRALRKA